MFHFLLRLIGEQQGPCFSKCEGTKGYLLKFKSLLALPDCYISSVQGFLSFTSSNLQQLKCIISFFPRSYFKVSFCFFSSILLVHGSIKVFEDDEVQCLIFLQCFCLDTVHYLVCHQIIPGKKKDPENIKIIIYEGISFCLITSK